MRAPSLFAVVVLAAAACTAPSRPTAQRSPSGSSLVRTESPQSNFGETLGVRVGGLFASAFRTEASLATDGGPSASVRFEDSLALDESTDALRADLYWRPSRHHRIDVSYFDLDRSGTRAIDRQIQWGDTTFDIGVEVTSRLRTEVLPIRYTYYFLANDDAELGFGAGIYAMSLTASLAGVGTVSGSTGAAQTSETFKTPVPLPVFGLQGGYAITPDLRATGSVQVFYLKLEDVGGADVLDGGLLDVLVGLEYDVMENIQIGTAANWFYLNVGAERDRLSFDLDYGFAGLFVYLGGRI